MTDFTSYQSQYSAAKLWGKIAKVAKKAGVKVIYVALLLFYVLKDPSVSTSDKAKIYGALGYFILPIDLIPDYIPVAGYTDDFAALIWALRAVYVNVTPAIQAQARQKLYNWFGDFDTSVLDSI